jgi:hypothetical protein
MAGEAQGIPPLIIGQDEENVRGAGSGRGGEDNGGDKNEWQEGDEDAAHGGSGKEEDVEDGEERKTGEDVERRKTGKRGGRGETWETEKEETGKAGRREGQGVALAAPLTFRGFAGALGL